MHRLHFIHASGAMSGLGLAAGSGPKHGIACLPYKVAQPPVRGVSPCLSRSELFRVSGPQPSWP